MLQFFVFAKVKGAHCHTQNAKIVAGKEFIQEYYIKEEADADTFNHEENIFVYRRSTPSTFITFPGTMVALAIVPLGLTDFQKDHGHLVDLHSIQGSMLFVQCRQT